MSKQADSLRFEQDAKLENVVWHRHAVDKAQRAALKQQRPAVLWFTGLSGAGKSTVAGALENRLAALGITLICWMVITCATVCVAISAFLSRIDGKTFAALVSLPN